MPQITQRDRDTGLIRPGTTGLGGGTLPTLIGAFLEGMRQRNFSRNTIDSYGSHARKYVRYLVATGTPDPCVEDFCRGTVRAFMQTVAAKGLAPRSVRTQIVALKMLGRWAEAEGLIAASPAEGLPCPRLGSPKRDTVTTEECLALLDACERLADPVRVALARAVMSAFCYGAFRRAELLGLRVDDVSLAAKSVTVVHGKGDRTRVVHPHPECFAALRSWLQVRPQDCRHPYLFALNRRQRLWNTGLTTLFREVKAIAGLKDNDRVHPHAMRRGCATRLLNQGYTIHDVQVFLGHSDMKTTQIYIAPDEQRLKGIAHLGGLRRADNPDGESQPVTGQAQAEINPVTQDKETLPEGGGPVGLRPSLTSWKDRARRPVRRATTGK